MYKNMEPIIIDKSIWTENKSMNTTEISQFTVNKRKMICSESNKSHEWLYLKQKLVAGSKTKKLWS
jgi:hypothetical protein